MCYSEHPGGQNPAQELSGNQNPAQELSGCQNPAQEPSGGPMTPESSPGGFQEADQFKQLSELNYKGLFFLGVPCSPPGSDLGAKNPAQEAPGDQNPAQEAPGS